MFQINANSTDVLFQIAMIIKVLFPLYAIAFALLGFRMLIDYLTDIFKKKYFPAKPKSSTPRRPRRSSIYVSSTRNPRIRRTKTGVYIYYD